MTFGERIKHFAKQSYGSQIKFAEVAGITGQQLNDYAQDKRLPSMEVLQKLHSAGLSLEWLLADENEVEKISMYAHNKTGRYLYKQATGKELPQTADEPLNADTKEAVRQSLVNTLKLLGE